MKLSIPVIFLVFSGVAFAEIQNGVEVGDVSAANQPESTDLSIKTIAPLLSATLINFDDITSSCLWSDGHDALRDEYAHLGVTFDGPGLFDGGAVMDECGGWGVTGHSSPNFLAFHTTAALNNGGRPIPPETITFSEPQTHVQINAGSGPVTDNVTLTCYNSVPALVGSDTITLASAMQTLSVQGSGIVNCEIDSVADYFVLDDLAFYSGPTTNQMSIDNGFIKLDTTEGIGPFDVDCASSDQHGRLIVDDVNGLLYVCTEAGWLAK